MLQKTILIVTNSDDAHVDQVGKRLRERSISASRLDSDTFTNELELWSIPSDSMVRNSWLVPDVGVVWYRKIILPEVMDATQSFIRQETEGLLDSILMSYHECRWVNSRSGITSARPKIAQLQRARQMEFRTPDSIVTTDVTSLKAFAERHNGNIVAKPMQAQIIGADLDARVVGTRRLNPEYYTSAVAGAPCYAQERLMIKSEIRAIVFGERVFAFRLKAIECADDLKQLPLDKIHHTPCVLDAEVTRKIHAFMLSYGLEFGAFDFAVVDQGEPYFLELNPNGQWLWLQYMTGVNLLDPFIDFLCI